MTCIKYHFENIGLSITESSACMGDTHHTGVEHQQHLLENCLMIYIPETELCMSCDNLDHQSDFVFADGITSTLITPNYQSKGSFIVLYAFCSYR